MKLRGKKTLFVLTIAGAAGASLGYPSFAHAVNWPILQGTELPDARTFRVWGFFQAQYEQDLSDPNQVNPAGQGQYVPPKLVGPNLDSQQGFNITRARLGVRGRDAPLDANTNYFLLAEFGNNAITSSDGGSAKLTDASMTFNHIPGARIRVGAFKYPTFEEGYQAIHLFDYVHFTELGNQLMLERFPNPAYTANSTPTHPLQRNTLNGFTQPVGAFRDIGVQVFDAFRTGDWEHTYAVMVGNGNGTNFTDNDDHVDTYFYLSTERSLWSGQGPFAEGLKFFAWEQDGSRQLDNTNDSTYNPQRFDRKRYGIGAKYLKKPFRLTAEAVKGKGMIFVGPDKPTFDIAPAGPLAAGGNGENGYASGWYVEGGWWIPHTKLELDLRYDLYRSLEGDLLETEWKTLTSGVQYRVNEQIKIILNYAIRDVQAVKFGSAGTVGPAGTALANPNNAYEGIGDRWALQFTVIF